MASEQCGEPHLDEIQREQERKLPERDVQRLSELYKALGDPTRIRIMSALSVSSLCVGDIATLLGMSQSAISHQLRVLRSAGLVKYHKSGKHVIYELDDDHVHSIFGSGLDHIHHQHDI
ncbi:MAG: metalloregulator ArsR/SmtB family transcription factor [Chloroflexota bacterium]